MTDTEVTLRTLSLGSQDSKTGWYGKSFDTSTIDMPIFPKGLTQVALQLGVFPKYDLTGFCNVPIREGDEILDKLGNYYGVDYVTNYNVGDIFYYADCALTLLSMHADRPTTSGTWPSYGDPRYRMKVWLDAYLNNANLLKDNGSTQVSFITMFDGADYPLSRVFTDKQVDLVYSIGESTSKGLYSQSKSLYGFVETTPINICCIDKTGITATRLKWQAEAELRRVCETYPFGSLRLMDTRRDTTQTSGSIIIYQTEFMLTYKRVSDTTPTTPSVTWGPSASPTGTFIFPNVMDIEYSHSGVDFNSHPPSFVGDIKQPMGDAPLRVKITSDLDIEPDALTWMRPQATTPKTDKMNWQVFSDIKHNGGINQAYQTLKLSWCATSGFKVRQQDYRVTPTGDTTILEVTYEEYTNTDKSGSTIAQRWNIA